MAIDPKKFTADSWQQHLLEVSDLEKRLDDSLEQIQGEFGSMREQGVQFISGMQNILGDGYLARAHLPSRQKCYLDTSITTDFILKYSYLDRQGHRVFECDLPEQLRRNVQAHKEDYKQAIMDFQERLRLLYETHISLIDILSESHVREQLGKGQGDKAVIYYFNKQSRKMNRVVLDLVTGREEAVRQTEYPSHPTTEQKQNMADECPDDDAYYVWHVSGRLRGYDSYNKAKEDLVAAFHEAHPQAEEVRHNLLQVMGPDPHEPLLEEELPGSRDDGEIWPGVYIIEFEWGESGDTDGVYELVRKTARKIKDVN